MARPSCFRLVALFCRAAFSESVGFSSSADRAGRLVHTVTNSETTTYPVAPNARLVVLALIMLHFLTYWIKLCKNFSWVAWVACFRGSSQATVNLQLPPRKHDVPAKTACD